MRAMEGWVIERPPFRGNGFAPGEGSDVIAEFKVDSARLPHGAQLLAASTPTAPSAGRHLRRRRLRSGDRSGSSDARRLRGPLAGRGYEASPDGDDVRLYRADPAEGFDEVAARPVRAGGAGRRGRRPRLRPHHLHLAGQPFIVLAEHDGWLRRRVHRRKAPGRRGSSGWRSSTTASTRAGRRRRGRRPARATGSDVDLRPERGRLSLRLRPAQDLAGAPGPAPPGAGSARRPASSRHSYGAMT